MITVKKLKLPKTMLSFQKQLFKKRIEELEKEYKSEPAYQFNAYGDKLMKEIIILKQILSQSTTPLIPEIEKAFDAGERYGTQVSIKDNKQDYISNLKLNI